MKKHKAMKTDADLNMELSARYSVGKSRQIIRKAKNFSVDEYFNKLDAAFNTSMTGERNVRT